MRTPAMYRRSSADSLCMLLVLLAHNGPTTIRLCDMRARTDHCRNSLDSLCMLQVLLDCFHDFLQGRTWDRPADPLPIRELCKSCKSAGIDI